MIIRSIKTFIISTLLICHVGVAKPLLSGGFWINYSYDENTYNTNFGDEALIIYLDSEKDPSSPWFYSAEFRIGPGGFSDKDNNTSGQNYVLHKAWLGYQFDENNSFIIGKSQLPFGWKTANFWPGDMFLAAYGDQMDVGIKYQGKFNKTGLQLAYYLRDDWASKSTDSTDDNRHWGSSSTYRKLNTLVADLNYQISREHQIGVSYQQGELEERVTNKRQRDGDHSAYALYYHANKNAFSTKFSLIAGERQLPKNYLTITPDVASTIKNRRFSTELAYTLGDWHAVVDITFAKSDTHGGIEDTVFAVAPGIRYDYGAGWIYLEHLNQDAYFDRNMQIIKGDFSAWYLTFDYYW